MSVPDFMLKTVPQRFTGLWCPLLFSIKYFTFSITPLSQFVIPFHVLSSSFVFTKGRFMKTCVLYLISPLFPLSLSLPLSPKTIKLKAEARLDLLRQVGVAVDTWLKSAMNQVCLGFFSSGFKMYSISECMRMYEIVWIMCVNSHHFLYACCRWWRSWRMNAGPVTLPTIPHCRWDMSLHSVGGVTAFLPIQQITLWSVEFNRSDLLKDTNVWILKHKRN